MNDTLIKSIIIIMACTCYILWINQKFHNLEKDIAVIKTVLLMRDTLPKELVKEVDEKT